MEDNPWHVFFIMIGLTAENMRCCEVIQLKSQENEPSIRMVTVHFVRIVMVFRMCLYSLALSQSTIKLPTQTRAFISTKG